MNNLKDRNVGNTLTKHNLSYKIVNYLSFLLGNQPDNSLVIGSPGKVVREVTEEEKKAVAENTRHYQENWKKYSKSIF